MLPQGCRRAESGQHGDLLDRVVGRLKQLLAARQPFRAGDATAWIRAPTVFMKAFEHSCTS